MTAAHYTHIGALYIGRNVDGRSPTEGERMHQDSVVEAMLAEAFSGFTLQAGRGLWRGKHGPEGEDSIVATVFLDGMSSDPFKLKAVAGAIARELRQECVACTIERAASVEFVGPDGGC